MTVIALKSSTIGDLLREFLARDLAYLSKEDILEVSQHCCAGQIYVTCRLSETEESRNVQIYYLSSALTDAIVQYYEPSLLTKLIKKEYPLSTGEERAPIFSRAQSILQGCNQSKLAAEARLQSKAHIMYALLDYLTTEQFLILDGFVSFRIRKYRHYLHHIVRMAAESIRRERAHREFIALLRSFVELQEPRTDIAHVIVGPNGLYRVLNRDYLPIETEYLEGFAVNLAEHDLDHEDLLISALLNIAPFHILLHYPPEWSVTDAVQSIFGSRVEYCPGCRQCEKSRKAIATAMANRGNRS